MHSVHDDYFSEATDFIPQVIVMQLYVNFHYIHRDTQNGRCIVYSNLANLFEASILTAPYIYIGGVHQGIYNCNYHSVCLECAELYTLIDVQEKLESWIFS